MRWAGIGILAYMLFVGVSVCPAQERHRPSTRAARAAQRAAAAATSVARPVDEAPVPVLPGDADWVRGLLVALGVIVVAAGVIGPIYGAWAPEEVAATHAHDEPPGASHRHGPGGERERGKDEG